ncbi:hypothetical protein BBP40_008902 [Aspergillus hancockii]|nr:hypothetical protein BBP40_008902 [Aspergillus hancockii]
MAESASTPRGGKKVTIHTNFVGHHVQIRCDRAKPACENCSLARVSCIFTARPAEARKSVRQQLSETQRQVQILETLVTDRGARSRGSCGPPEALRSSRGVHSAQPDLHDTDDFGAALSTFQQHLENSWPEGDRSSYSATFYSVISQQTGSQFNLDDFFHQVTQSYKSRYATEGRPQPVPKWPEKLLVKQCLDYYSRKGIYSVFPVADTGVFYELLDAGVLDDLETPSRTANKACLVAFTALIAQLHRHSPIFAHAEPDAYIRAVLMLLPNLFMEGADVRTLETFIILAIYIQPTGQSYPAEMLLAAAVRIIYRLGGHRQRPPDGAQGQNQSHYHLRALFWLSYWIDKEMCLRACREPIINDADCDLELPSTYVSQSSTYQFLQAPISSDILLFPSDLRLALIKSRIYRLLYSEVARAQTEAIRMQRILELDQELGALESSFPAHCQPHVFATPDCPVYAFHDLSMRGVTLHLDYYYCVKRIHEANAACSTPSSFSSGMGLSYQTSRCMLIYIIQVHSFITWHSFWIYAQWLLSAVVSLFNHCMCNPTSPSFAGDIEILENTMEVFTSRNQNSQGARCFPPFYITEAFIDTLIRLAKQSFVQATSM